MVTLVACCAHAHDHRFEDDLTANVELGNARWESWFNATLAWNTDCFFFIDDDDDANAH